MEEESRRRDPRGAIMEEQSWRRNHGGGTHEAPRRHPGGTQEAPRRHPGGAQKAFRGTQGTQEAPRGLGSEK